MEGRFVPMLRNRVDGPTFLAEPALIKWSAQAA
jgi:hypothetical protein